MAQEFDPRSGEIRQAIEARRADDTRIMQKVNQAHREAFQVKFPNQVEHCMRLVAERLQQGLKKDSDVQLSDCSARDLAVALRQLYKIHQDITKA